MNKPATRIMVVDDALDTLEVLERNLSSQGYLVSTASEVAQAISILESQHIDLVITDLKMPGASGLDLVGHIRESYRDTEVMMITGYATVEGAVQAVKAGADEYLAKPFTGKELLSAVHRTLEKLRDRRNAHAPSGAGRLKLKGLIGESEVMLTLFETVRKAAGSAATILISGESGTGKELVARGIHYNSDRAAAPFVTINCGAIPEGLLESELFGYIKGAFTGADRSRAGFFQSADQGTIFLDEISETSLTMQVKLLRVLQEKEINLLGSSRPVAVDVRILTSTNKDLLNLIEKGLFRQDLFYRLNIIHIHLPPLRERTGDILLLVNHFSEKYSQELSKKPLQFTDRALEALKSYDWPGNVRELENLVQRLVTMGDGPLADVPDLPSFMHRSKIAGIGLHRSLAEVEAEHIARVLNSVSGNKTEAARILGIDRKTLREKLKKHQPG